ncbi:MAG: TIM44-like domain-containing protein [Myxococcales bacterium]|nr:TIM44-like domain-containing protein [Myxococcales bacterium]
MTRRTATPALLGLLLLGLAAAAEARPGGGHSYSGGGSHSYSSSSHSSGGGGGGFSFGGSSSSSSSSSSGDTSPLELVLLVVACGAILALQAVFKSEEQDSGDFGGGAVFHAPAPAPAPTARTGPQVYEVVRRTDPEFSAVLFEDFVYALYARVHGARNDPAALAALAPYVAADSRAALARREPRGVAIHGVVIGRMEALKLERDGGDLRVELEFESNYTAELPGGARGYYVRERWTLARAEDAQTRAPAAVYSFHCPACGAPYQRSDAGTCSHCGQQVEDGRFDWQVRSVRLYDHEPRPPALTGDVAERGTGLPTVVDRALRGRHAALLAEDPHTTELDVERRLHDIYHTLNDAWTACDLRPVRPFVSDSMFNYLSYWIDAYRAQGLRNVLKDMEISRVQLVKLIRDRHFDALTVRIWATGLDYTEDAQGRRVAGNARSKRAYSEYWTLIRGASVRGVSRDPAKCPSCGGPLDRVNMAGNCEYCGAHLTRGEFDWVLGKIQQDESYTG